MKCEKIDAGLLRHRVTVEKKTFVSDGAGGQVDDWAPVVILQAWIRPISGMERLVAEHLQAELTHEIVTRYVEGIHAGMRIVFGTRVFAIDSVMDVEERRQWLRFRVREGAPS